MDLMKLYYEYDGHAFNPILVKEALKNLVIDPTLGRAWFINLSCENPADSRVIGYVVLTFGYSLEFPWPGCIHR